MVTDQQVLPLRRRIVEGKSQQASAAAAGMSVRSARRWQTGQLPSDKNKRSWRTRPDAFAGVWEEEIVPLLRRDARKKLQATVLLEWLNERHPGRFNASHLRTLQRRLRDWRALSGPDREMYFEQEHPPGREAQMDFTHCGEFGVTIGGEPFEHMMFEFVLSHSCWRYAEVAYAETFTALVIGLQGALWELGAVPEVVRTDNLSAATHDLRDSRGRAFNESYQPVVAQYGLKATCTNPPKGHAHWTLKMLAERMAELDYADSIARETVRKSLNETSSGRGRRRSGASLR